MFVESQELTYFGFAASCDDLRVNPMDRSDIAVSGPRRIGPVSRLVSASQKERRR